MPPHGAPSSPLPPTVADREAELAALQAAFDEYISSSRELEDELDAELTKMQEKLSESSAANVALAAQLESVHPQLSSLEKSLASAKVKLEMERDLRRKAELAQDEAEGRAREVEGSLSALRHEHDDVMEDMAFKDEELEEVRLELDVERERMREVVEELRGDLEVERGRTEKAEREVEELREELRQARPRDEADEKQPEATSEEQASEAVVVAAVAASESEAEAEVALEAAEEEVRGGEAEGGEADDGASLPLSPATARDDDVSLDDDLRSADDGSRTQPDTLDPTPSGLSSAHDEGYMKELENELETVTEQLITAETRAVDLEADVESAQQRGEEAEGRVKELEEQMNELRETMSAGASEEREAVHRLMDEVSTVKLQSEKYREELELANEELHLVQEEMKAAEEDLATANTAMEQSEIRRKSELDALGKELEAARAEASEARTEADSLAGALQDANAEEQSLREELSNLTAALENAKRDHSTVVDEMQALRKAFDDAERAREEGVGWKEEEMRRELMEAHRREVDELREELEGLEGANASLKKMVEELEASRSECVDVADAAAAVGVVAAKSEETEKLEKELAKARRDLVRQEKEAERLKADLEGRFNKTAAELSVAENELEMARTQLAEMEEKLAELEANQETMRTPSQSERKKLERQGSTFDEKSGVGRKLFPSAESLPQLSYDEEDDAGSTAISAFHRTHARSRKRTRHSSGRRARSSSPTTVVRLEKELDRQTEKAKELSEEVEKSKDQYRMAEAKVTHLENEVKSLQAGAAVVSAVATTPTMPGALASYVPITAAQYDLSDSRDDAEESARPVDDVLASGDPALIETEYRALDQRSQVLREKNASLLQKILSLQSNIQVCCRIRPMKPSEVGAGLRGVAEPVGETEVGCFDSRTKNWKSYNFDRVWGPESTQTGVFRDVEQLALSVVDGYNACIFAYGQTGSGKTYTMEGTPAGNQYGVSYRTIQKLFSLLHFRAQMQKQTSEDAPPFNFSLQVGMLEIYNDEVYDLLTPFPDGVKSGKKAPLEVRRGADGYVEVPGLTKEGVNSLQDVLDLLKRGTQNRASASTNLNEHSSRSHMILNVSVASGLEGQPGCKGNLYLVDLAGSERVRRSEVEGKELKEAGFINKSLSALGNVMEALDRKAKHVPYRDSKLTYLLQDSLGGNSRTMMIVTVNPTSDSFDETQYALQFATRVRRIQLGTATRNVSSKNLEETVKNLTSEMKLLAKAKVRSEQQMMSLKRENKRVQDRLQSASEARAKASDESRALAVLQKGNAEMTERWKKEKTLRDQKAADLENCQKELHRVQQQLQKSVRNMDNISKELVSKEQTISDLTAKLRAAKEETIQAKQKARKSQIIAPKVTSAGGTTSTTRLSRSSGIPKKSSLPSASDAKAVDPPEMNGAPNSLSENGDTTRDPDVMAVRNEVLELLRKHDSTKVDRIDTLMDKFKGREQFLLDKMHARYEGGSDKEKDKPSKPRATKSSMSSMSAKQRSEMALKRHKERMQNRKSSGGAGGPPQNVSPSLLQSKLNG